MHICSTKNKNISIFDNAVSIYFIDVLTMLLGLQCFEKLAPDVPLFYAGPESRFFHDTAHMYWGRGVGGVVDNGFSDYQK